MAKEIERKFLVVGDEWRKTKGVSYRQGYLSTAKERTVRVRTTETKGFLTIKGMQTGISRPEFEYEIPVDDAKQMLDELCEKPLIEKTRHIFPKDDVIWEIDEFSGENKGLIIAEVELPTENHKIEKPSWVGEEVSKDPKYFNSSLVKRPYKTWK